MVPKKTRRLRGEEKQRPRLALPFCMLLCIAFLVFQGRLYGSAEDSAYGGLLGLQLPFLYAMRPAPTPAPEPVAQAQVDAGVGESFRVELKSIQSAQRVDLSGSEPRILIYHTHTTEAYRQTPDSPYEESGDWRTHDQTRNIVAVGEKLAALLRDKYGLSVLHDVTDHEPPKLSTSYSRSVVTMQRYKKEYPSLTLFIDVHRDAYGSSGGEDDFVLLNGRETARVMFVVGTGEGATGSGFEEMPDFKANYALAAAVTERMQAVDAALMRDIRVKTGRYNQHISDQCLLVEVGHNQNTLEQALNAVDHLAAALADVAGVRVPAARAGRWAP